MRDYYDRVIVMPPEHKGPLTGEWRHGVDRKTKKPKSWWYSKEGIGYTRTSSAGKSLDNKENLADWKACMAAIGVILSESARSEIVTLINEYDGDPYYKGDDGGMRSGKTRLKSAVEEAGRVAGNQTASSRGTEFHLLGQITNRGETPRVIQDHLKEPLKHYRERVAPIKFLHQEILIINDLLQLAGSIDYLMELPAGMVTPDGVVHEEPMVVGGDLKTGRWDAKMPLGVTCQVAGYATGCRYDQASNTRTPLHPNMNTDWGVLVHYPLAEPDAEVKFYWLDMRLGVEGALLGRKVDDFLKLFKKKDNQLREFTL